MNGPIHQKPKARPRKQRIKAMLKRVVLEHNVEKSLLLYLLVDYLQDGAIDGSALGLLGVTL